MVKKSHAPTGGLPAVITGSANQIFLAGLGAFAKAQEDGTKIFDTLVEEGTKVFNGLVAGVRSGSRARRWGGGGYNGRNEGRGLWHVEHAGRDA